MPPIIPSKVSPKIGLNGFAMVKCKEEAEVKNWVTYLACSIKFYVSAAGTKYLAANPNPVAKV